MVSTAVIHFLRLACATVAVALPAPAEAQSPDSAPVARIALDAPGLNWRALRTAHADVYVLAGSAAEPLAASLPVAIERAIGDNLKWLGARDSTSRLRLFFVGSRQQMTPFTGRTPGGWAVTSEGTAFFVANDTVRPAIRHETMHLLSWREWGTPAGNWLSEGVAVVAAGPCRGHSVDDITAAMDRAGKLVALDVLRRQFEVGGEVGAVHYFESASLVTYIDRTYGRDALRELWSRGGLVRARETLGVTADTLETHWRSAVAKTEPSSSWPELWRDIRAHGCE